MNNLNTLSSNEDIKDKIIFLRVDFNIPIKDGKVIDDTKIVNMKDIINKLLSKKTKIILLALLMMSFFFADKPNVCSLYFITTFIIVRFVIVYEKLSTLNASIFFTFILIMINSFKYKIKIYFTNFITYKNFINKFTRSF